MVAPVVSCPTCALCGGRLPEPFLDLGEQAPANALLSSASAPECAHPLSVTRCPDCGLVQLSTVLDRAALFSADYAYHTSTSPQLHAHFRRYAERLAERFPDEVARDVVEVGSNDGLFLAYLARVSGARVLGVDPATGAAEVARTRGVETVPGFFGRDVGARLARDRGRVGAVVMNNVLAHTPDPVDLARGAGELLKVDGVLVGEVAYFPDMVRNGDFTSVYHEHVSYFSLASLAAVLDRAGLRVFDVERVPTQGGSLRFFADRGRRRVEASVEERLSDERAREGDLGTLAPRAEALRAKLREMLAGAGVVAAVGASAKAAVLFQYCGLRDEVAYVTDEAEHKQGRFMPGTRQQVAPPSRLREDAPDIILVTAWNYAQSIVERERWFLDSGGRFVVPLPELRIE